MQRYSPEAYIPRYLSSEAAKGAVLLVPDTGERADIFGGLRQQLRRRGYRTFVLPTTSPAELRAVSDRYGSPVIGVGHKQGGLELMQHALAETPYVDYTIGIGTPAGDLLRPPNGAANIYNAAEALGIEQGNGGNVTTVVDLFTMASVLPEKSLHNPGYCNIPLVDIEGQPHLLQVPKVQTNVLFLVDLYSAIHAKNARAGKDTTTRSQQSPPQFVPRRAIA